MELFFGRKDGGMKKDSVLNDLWDCRVMQHDSTAFFWIFMMEQRRGEGPRGGPADLIGMESQGWLIKTRAIVKHAIDCYLTLNSVFWGLRRMFFLGSPSWGSLVHRSPGT